MYLPYVAQHVIGNKKCYTIGVSYNMWRNKLLGGGLSSLSSSLVHVYFLTKYMNWITPDHVNLQHIFNYFLSTVLNLFLCALRTDSTVKQSLSFRVCIRKCRTVQFQHELSGCFSHHYCFNTLMDVCLHSARTHARMFSRTPTHMRWSIYQYEKLWIIWHITHRLQAKICVCCYVTIGYSDRCITSTFLFCQVGGGIVDQQ